MKRRQSNPGGSSKKRQATMSVKEQLRQQQTERVRAKVAKVAAAAADEPSQDSNLEADASRKRASRRQTRTETAAAKANVGRKSTSGRGRVDELIADKLSRSTRSAADLGSPVPVSLSAPEPPSPAPTSSMPAPTPAPRPRFNLTPKPAAPLVVPALPPAEKVQRSPWDWWVQAGLPGLNHVFALGVALVVGSLVRAWAAGPPVPTLPLCDSGKESGITCSACPDHADCVGGVLVGCARGYWLAQEKYCVPTVLTVARSFAWQAVVWSATLLCTVVATSLRLAWRHPWTAVVVAAVVVELLWWTWSAQRRRTEHALFSALLDDAHQLLQEAVDDGIDGVPLDHLKHTLLYQRFPQAIGPGNRKHKQWEQAEQLWKGRVEKDLRNDPRITKKPLKVGGQTKECLHWTSPIRLRRPSHEPYRSTPATVRSPQAARRERGSSGSDHETQPAVTSLQRAGSPPPSWVARWVNYQGAV